MFAQLHSLMASSFRRPHFLAVCAVGIVVPPTGQLWVQIIPPVAPLPCTNSMYIVPTQSIVILYFKCVQCTCHVMDLKFSDSEPFKIPSSSSRV